MISALFTALQQVVTGFGGVIGSAFTNITAMFYDATNGLTTLGSLLLITAGVGLVYWAFRMIKRLVKLK